jgi:transcriptional regulator of acetoin/glycerol metabolism
MLFTMKTEKTDKPNKLKTAFAQEVEAVIRRYLEDCDWNLSRASRALGLTIPTVRKLAKNGGFWPHS